MVLNMKLLLRVHGTWDSFGKFHSKYESVIDVPSESSLKELKDLVKGLVSMDWSQYDIRFSYIVASCPPPIVIADDAELLFYLKLKTHQNEVSHLPLCMEVFPILGVHHLSSQSTTPDDHVHGMKDCCTSHLPTSSINTILQTNTFTCGSYESPNSSLTDDAPVLSNESSKTPKRTKQAKLLTSSMDVISHYHPTTIQVHSVYKSKEDLCHHLQMYAVSNSFQFRTKRSSRTTLHVVCVDDHCSWALRAVSLDDSPLFQIRRFDSHHSCPVGFQDGYHRQATSSFIADLVLHRYVDATKKQYAPNDLRDDMRREFGIEMSYRKALLVKQKAFNKLYGSDEDSYQLLPSFCYMLETKNPSSSIRLVRTEDQRFKYLFISLAPWRQAWNHCIPVLVVDGTFMKSYYKGTLLTACCQDANKQLVPIAFGVCDVEDKDSWFWFFTELKNTLTPRDDLYIVSDRHEGIIYAAEKVFPHAGHGYCTEHIARNLRAKFRGPKKLLAWKFRQACRAATEVECEEYLQMLDEQDKRVRAYITAIGESKWARCKSGPERFSVMTSNAAESMNNVNNTAREYPISKLIDFIRERMQKWFHERFDLASTTTTILPQKLESELLSLQRDANRMKVKPSCPYEFEVTDRWTRTFVVNLRDKSCTCGEFQLNHFVCVHAVAGIASRPGLSCYNFISLYYKREALLATYSSIVHPIGDKSSWDVPSDVKSMTCMPPSCHKRPPGRPKKRRLPSVGEFHFGQGRKKQRCTRCLGTGHNVKTCTNPIPA